jgi:hypothetical protein
MGFVLADIIVFDLSRILADFCTTFERNTL